jgi:hypothetical protein
LRGVPKKQFNEKNITFDLIFKLSQMKKYLLGILFLVIFTMNKVSAQGSFHFCLPDTLNPVTWQCYQFQICMDNIVCSIPNQCLNCTTTLECSPWLPGGAPGGSQFCYPQNGSYSANACNTNPRHWTFSYRNNCNGDHNGTFGDGPIIISVPDPNNPPKKFWFTFNGNTDWLVEYK